MKVEINLHKKLEDNQNNYQIGFNIVDDYLPEDSKYIDCYDVVKRMIIRFCSRPKVDGWAVRTLAKRVREGEFKLWEVVGIRQIILDYNQLYLSFEHKYKEELNNERERYAVDVMSVQVKASRENWTEADKKKAMRAIKPVRVVTPAMKFYRHCRENGTVKDLQQHFAKYGISESTFYRMFFDTDSKYSRKDIGKRDFAVGKAVRGMGRFYTYEMKGLKYYLDNFMEQFGQMTPMHDVELMRVITDL